jgi:hypothetical protein
MVIESVRPWKDVELPEDTHWSPQLHYATEEGRLYMMDRTKL